MRFSLLLPTFALLVAAPLAACAAAVTPELLRQDITVQLAPESHQLSGESSTSFAPGGGRVAFRLSPKASVAAVSVAGHPVPYSFTGGMLLVDLPRSSSGQSLSIAYRASFNDPVSQTPGASEDPTYGVSATITREGSFLGDSSHWYPVPVQVPLKRSLRVSAPAGTEAVSFGRRVLRETGAGVTRSQWEEANPVGALSLCAGPYRVEDRTVDGIELHSYLYPQNAALSGRYLDAAARYLRFYSQLFGPYPFEKFAVVENFFQTGYGFPSFTLLGGAVLRLPFIVDTSFPHEIAHSWWGNAISIAPDSGNWCEGLVTYLADYLLKEKRSPAEARDYREQLLVDFASLVPAISDFPLKDFESRSDPASRTIGYGKAAMLFHMVRSQIGDAAFFAALRQVAREHTYRSASWTDFERAFSKSSGRDLAPFMNQWLVRTGGPRLRLAELRTVREKEGWSVTGVVLQEGSPYRLDLPLTLESASGAVQARVPLNDARSRFKIAGAEEPTRLLLDPGAEVFRILSRDEIPATVNSVKGSTQLVGVLTDNCRAGADGFRDLLASLSQGGARVVREEELGGGEQAGLDLIFCGVPRERSLLPRLPGGLRVEPDGFTLQGASYSAPDALLFLVLRRPGNSGRVAALYQPLSEAAARQYYPKITHYGKYAELVFAEGANRRKGMVPVGEGAAAVVLAPAGR